jgi:hypothetical protein
MIGHGRILHLSRRPDFPDLAQGPAAARVGWNENPGKRTTVPGTSRRTQRPAAARAGNGNRPSFFEFPCEPSGDPAVGIMTAAIKEDARGATRLGVVGKKPNEVG